MRRVSANQWLALGFLTLALALLVALYFLNLLPFAHVVNLKTDEDVRAHVMRKGTCKQIDRLERLKDDEWLVTCDTRTKLLDNRFWVKRDGAIQSEADVIGF